MHHRHVGLTAGDFGATVEDEGGGEVHGGKGRLRGEKLYKYRDCQQGVRPRMRERASSNDLGQIFHTILLLLSP